MQGRRHHGHDTLHQGIERFVGKTGTFDHTVSFLRFGQTGDGRSHVVIERKQIDPSAGQPLRDVGFGIEIVGLMAQEEAGIRRQLRPQGLDGLKQSRCIVAASQARFPGPCRGVKNRGDAISDGLPVTVDQRYIDGKIDTGARHHLSLERVAVQIDYPRQHQQTAGIETK
jgi:hypothetical protein